MGKRGKKQNSQLFTFAELVKNNKAIFAKQYPRGWNENDSHYICKVFFGEHMRKRFPRIELFYEFDGLPDLGTELSPRFYKPDIFIFLRNEKDNVFNISVIEIDGLIHKASKHQFNKTKWRREAIIDYFINLRDEKPIVFSFMSFEPDDFLYHKLDYFINIFDKYFFEGGSYPPINSYERIFL